MQTTPYRPAIAGTRHMVSAGHYGAAHAAFLILEAGGNAVDAGVAAGMALGVLQSDLVNFAGVAPIILYDAKTDAVHAIAGLGTWPKRADVAVFHRDHGGKIPHGLLRTVVPAAPEAWITALARFGTMSFADCAAAAIRFARDGSPIHALFAETVKTHADEYRRWPANAAIYLPKGRPPALGEVVVQEDLARTIQYMADCDRAASKHGREAGLKAARDAFYRGDIAAAITRYHRDNGGWLREDDLAEFQAPVEKALKTTFAGIDIYACDAWCQGPALLQAFNLVDPETLKRLGHNSVEYIHHLAELLKLVFADRERWYGDPRFVDVPLDRLLSHAYAAERRKLIKERAYPALPPAMGEPVLSRDTSYVCVVDRHGNVFSATPSDTSYDTPVIPGTGLCPSSRGSQSRTDPRHPSCLAPGKRPRLTPNPGLAIKPGAWAMPFGTPGGDVQIQAMVQTVLNVVLFGLDPQSAVERPRFATFSFPDSFAPHDYFPGRLTLERGLGEATGAALAARGHDVTWWPDFNWRAGAVCTIVADKATGVLTAGADPRRASYALGW